MVSTFTTARNLEKPAAGDQIGTWGTASINPDLDVIDAGMGQTATISGAAGNVVLASAQFRCSQIVINSTLVGSISITFPSTFTGPYTVYNACTGSSAFIITMTTTAAGGEVIAAPPGELIDVFNDGTNLRYRNLERVGTIIPTMYSSLPAWIDACTKKPYFNCDGSVFSSATYPVLAVVLAGNTLPDARGSYLATLNQGTARITTGSSTGGVDGDTRGARGGTQTTTLSSQNIPPVPIVDPGHLHRMTAANNLTGGGAANCAQSNFSPLSFMDSCAAFTGITAGNASPTNFPNLPPTTVTGITMIRSA